MKTGLFVTIVGPPIRSEGIAAIIRSIPYIAETTIIADPTITRTDLLTLTADIVVVCQTNVLPSASQRDVCPISWILFTEDEKTLPDAAPVVLHYDDNIATVRAGVFAAISRQRYASPNLESCRLPLIQANSRITYRERQALLFAAYGDTNRQIAARLGIGVESVKTHLQSAFRKLKIHRRTQIAWVLSETDLREYSSQVTVGVQ